MAFVVRWLHVTSVAFLFGGALLLFILFLVSKRRAGDRQTMLDLMQAYEWGSWVAVGLIVMTGAGNLGHLGDALPDPNSEWGQKLTIKLGMVGVFLVFSAVRSLGVTLVQLRAEAQGSLPGALQAMYALTAVFVAAILGVAVALAHF